MTFNKDSLDAGGQTPARVATTQRNRATVMWRYSEAPRLSWGFAFGRRLNVGCETSTRRRVCVRHEIWTTDDRISPPGSQPRHARSARVKTLLVVSARTRYGTLLALSTSRRPLKASGNRGRARQLDLRARVMPRSGGNCRSATETATRISTLAAVRIAARSRREGKTMDWESR